MVCIQPLFFTGRMMRLVVVCSTVGVQKYAVCRYGLKIYLHFLVELVPAVEGVHGCHSSYVWSLFAKFETRISISYAFEELDFVMTWILLRLFLEKNAAKNPDAVSSEKMC